MKDESTAKWCLLWLSLVAAGLALRPLLPVDETRYASVAWEMWLSGNYLVPHLNGETYSHKPPLLFWLMNAGWAVFGVNDWTHRLVAPVFALASLFLTARLARRLWPESKAHAHAPLLLIAGIFWATFSTLTMFDMMVATWVLVGILGLIGAADGEAKRGWGLVAVAIGLGVLSKGPVIVVFIVPAALAAPYWATGPRLADAQRGWARWYAHLGLATLGGAAIALAWALPAGISGGEAYRNAIFWGQSAGRMVDSFAHAKPIYWYLGILPPMLLPWLLWPSVWQGLARSARALRDPARTPDAGARLIAVWIGVPFVVFSLFSGKAPHYLLPFLPAVALAAARAVERLPDGAVRLRLTTPLAVLGALIVVTVYLAANPQLRDAYDLRPTAHKISDLQRAGYAIGHYGNYHAQFQFLGRLERPIEEIGDGNVIAWLNAHPKAKVVSTREALPPNLSPDFVQNFRSRILVIWDRADVLADPKIARREAGED